MRHKKGCEIKCKNKECDCWCHVRDEPAKHAPIDVVPIARRSCDNCANIDGCHRTVNITGIAIEINYCTAWVK